MNRVERWFKDHGSTLLMTVVTVLIAGAVFWQMAGAIQKTHYENADFYISSVEQTENGDYKILGGGLEVAYDLIYNIEYNEELPPYVEEGEWCRATYSLENYTIQEFHGPTDSPYMNNLNIIAYLSLGAVAVFIIVTFARKRTEKEAETE